jgi:hypothetical protein
MRRCFFAASIAVLAALFAFVPALQAQDNDEALKKGDEALKSLNNIDESILGDLAYGLFMNGHHIGYVIQKTAKGSLDGKDVYVFTIEMKMAIGTEMENLKKDTSYVAPDMTLLKSVGDESERMGENAKPQTKTIEVVLTGGKYRITTTRDGASETAEISTDGKVVCEVMNVVTRKLKMTEGAEYAFRTLSIDPDGSTIVTEKISVGKKVPFEINGKSTEAFEVAWDKGKDDADIARVSDSGVMLEVAMKAQSVSCTLMEKNKAVATEDMTFKFKTPEEAMKDSPKAAVSMMYDCMRKKDAEGLEKHYNVEEYCANMLTAQGTEYDRTDKETWAGMVDEFKTGMIEGMLENAAGIPGPSLFMVVTTEKIAGDKAEVCFPDGIIFNLVKESGLWKIHNMIQN